MTLKEEIDRLRNARIAERKKVAEARAAEEQQEHEANVSQAREIIKVLPDGVKKALAEDKTSVMLLRGAEIPTDVGLIAKGVAYELVILLTAEGLLNNLWVDIHADVSHRSLMFTI